MVSDTEFRQVTGQFATGVTVVTVDPGDEPHGMTVNSFASVSLEPPLVLFNADVSTNTHDYVARAEHFAVNVLTQDQDWLSTRFAGDHHDMADPFEDVEVGRRESGAPIIEDSLAYLDCRLYASFEGGDHTIYVGEVVDLGLLEAETEPLLFYRGEYRSIR